MPTAPPFPTIPTPTNDPNALLESVLALKQAVELLTGQAADQNKFAAHVFVQADEPTAIHVGDLWLCTAKNYSLNMWDGQNWLKSSAPIAPLETQQATFHFEKFIRAKRK